MADNMEDENITHRQKQRTPLFVHNSLDENIMDHDGMSFDSSTRSLPNINNLELEEYQSEISSLKIKLSSADDEINTLLSQNSQLSQRVEKLSRVVALYKKIGLTENSISSINSPVIRRVKRILSSPVSPPTKNITTTNNQSTQTDNIIGSTKNSLISKKYKMKLKKQRKKINNLKKRITKLQIQNQRIKEDMDSLQKINIEQYEQLFESDSSEHSLTFTKESVLADDTVLQQEHVSAMSPLCQDKEVIPSNHISGIPKPMHTDNRKTKVLILADQQGKGIRTILQRLLGDKYDVFCFWKSGGKINDLLNSCISEIPTLTMNDCVILFSFSNDDSMSSIRERLLAWCEGIKNTNIIICENSSNSYLKEGQINNILRKISGQFTNATFLDMEFSKQRPKLSYFSIHACRFILREILRLHYTTNRLRFNLENKNDCSIESSAHMLYYDTSNCKLNNNFVSRGTQTDFGFQKSDNSNCDEFFRI